MVTDSAGIPVTKLTIGQTSSATPPLIKVTIATSTFSPKRRIAPVMAPEAYAAIAPRQLAFFHNNPYTIAMTKSGMSRMLMIVRYASTAPPR